MAPRHRNDRPQTPRAGATAAAASVVDGIMRPDKRDCDYNAS
jgi:hypothetical protein